MKAAFLNGLRSIIVKDGVPVLEIKPGEVLVRVKAVGICGSDVHYYKEGRIGSNKAVYPYIIGHECSGIIEKTGSEVKKARPGMRVAVEPAIYCYSCSLCRDGKYNVCPDVAFLGTPPIQGAFCEYLPVPEENVIEIPEDMSYEAGALLEPLGVAVHAVKLSELWDKADCDKDIAVYGCGTIGLSVLAVIRKLTKGKIYAIDKLDYRLAAAKELGADFLINNTVTDPAVFIMQRSKYGADICFEAAGSADAMKNAAEITAPGGETLLIGIPEEDSVCFDPHALRKKELNVKFVRRSNFDTHDAIEIMKQDKEKKYEKIVTHTLSLDDIEKGFELMGSYSDNAIKIMVKIGDRNE